MLCRLLGGWHKRWPSPEFDDVDAWDDIVQNRLIFLNHIQERLNQQIQGIRIDEGSADSVTSLLNAERAHLYLNAANGLMACGAFHASQVH